MIFDDIIINIDNNMLFLYGFIILIITYITYVIATTRKSKRMKIEQRIDAVRDGFAAKKVPKELDAIVIGSGLGGLMCAGFLAKCGKRVLVLEQHYIAGGCTHTFEESGYEFDTGLHYIGDIERFQPLLDLVGSKKYPISFNKLGEDDDYCFDRFLIGRNENAKVFKMKAHTLLNDLIAEFPNEEESIRKWFKMCHACMNTFGGVMLWKLLPNFLANISIIQRMLLGSFRKYATKSIWEVVCDITNNPRLRLVLIGNFGDVGGDPDKSSFMMQAGVFTHYVDGGFYPNNGPQSLSYSIIDTIEEAGGRVLVRAPVSEIILNDDQTKVTGVRVKGVEIRCPLVVSGIGVYNTFNTLLSKYKKSNESSKTEELIKKEGPSATHGYCFVGLNKSSKELKLPSSNLWVLPCNKTYDLLKDLRDLENNPFGDTPLYMFIGFPSAKDPYFSKRFPNKSTAVVLTELPAATFEKFSNNRFGNRGKEYEALKKRLQDLLLDGLLQHYPHLKDHIEFVDSATPMSAKHFLASSVGESYGLGHSKTRHGDPTYLRMNRAITDIKGLYLTGQDTISSGIFPSALSGLITAFTINGFPIREMITSTAYLKLLYTLIRIIPPSIKTFFRAF